jgi:hypothetical protein
MNESSTKKEISFGSAADASVVNSDLAVAVFYHFLTEDKQN